MNKLLLILPLMFLSGCHDHDSTCSLSPDIIGNSNIDTVVTPEPSTILLLAFGLMILFTWVWFRPILKAQFCYTCLNNGWGKMLSGECRCKDKE